MNAIRSRERGTLAAGLALGVLLALGAPPGIRYAAGQFSPSVGSYSYSYASVLFTGRATALAVAGIRVSDTGTIRTPESGDTGATLVRTPEGLNARAEALIAINHRRVVAPGGRIDPLSLSIAGAASVRVTLAGHTIEADSVASLAAATCSGRRVGSSTLQGLTVDGVRVLKAQLYEGSVTIGPVALEFDRQTRSPSGISVVALQASAFGASASIGVAGAGVEGCVGTFAPGWNAVLADAHPSTDPFGTRWTGSHACGESVVVLRPRVQGSCAVRVHGRVQARDAVPLPKRRVHQGVYVPVVVDDAPVTSSGSSSPGETAPPPPSPSPSASPAPLVSLPLPPILDGLSL